jgi:hypothetical protein
MCLWYDHLCSSPGLLLPLQLGTPLVSYLESTSLLSSETVAVRFRMAAVLFFTADRIVRGDQPSNTRAMSSMPWR